MNILKGRGLQQVNMEKIKLEYPHSNFKNIHNAALIKIIQYWYKWIF
jgi:hypothetical protein